MANFTEKIKQMKFKDFIYPATAVLGLAVFIVMFWLTIKFLFNSINTVFVSGEEEGGLVRFNIDGFNKIAGKLGIE